MKDDRLRELCAAPRKFSEQNGFEVWGRTCAGTTFFELRGRDGRTIQNFNQLKQAERAMTEQVARAEQRKKEMTANPDLERVNQAFQHLAGHGERTRIEQRKRFEGLPLEQIPVDLLTDEERETLNTQNNETD